MIRTVHNCQDRFISKIDRLFDFREIELINVNVQSEMPKSVEIVDLRKPDTIWTKIFGKSDTYYVLPLQCEIHLVKRIELILKYNEERVNKEYLKEINTLIEELIVIFRDKLNCTEEDSLYQRAMHKLYSGNVSAREEGLKLLFQDYEERQAEETVKEINKQLPIYDGENLEYIGYKILFLRKNNDFDWGGQLLFGCKNLDGTENIVFVLKTAYASVPYKVIKGYGKVYIVLEYDDKLFLYEYNSDGDVVGLLDFKAIPTLYVELVLEWVDEGTLKYGKHSYFESNDDKIFEIKI